MRAPNGSTGFNEVLGGDFDVGATEGGDANADVGGVVTTKADDLCGEVEIAETTDCDGVADSKAAGGETDWTIGTAEHEAKGVHLGVRDSGKGALGLTAVHHEGTDEGKGDQKATLLLGGMDEDDVGDDDTLDHLATLAIAVLVEAHLLLGGDEDFVAELLKLTAGLLLGVGVDVGYIPPALRLQGVV